MKSLDDLAAENLKLKKALAALIPWAGESADGPSWGTDVARVHNRAMCKKAIADACACFPEDFDGVVEDEITR